MKFLLHCGTCGPKPTRPETHDLEVQERAVRTMGPCEFEAGANFAEEWEEERIRSGQLEGLRDWEERSETRRDERRVPSEVAR